jgi:signal transduction histidine kinase
VAYRRFLPVHALGVQLFAELLADLLVPHSSYFWSSGVPMALTTYTVARTRPWPLLGWAWAPPLVLILEAVRVPQARDVLGWCTMTLLFGFTGAAGQALRRNADRRRRLADAVDALAAMQREREEIAVLDERRRIRNEIDDVLAHVMGDMLLQMGAARAALLAAGLEVPTQLEAAESTGRQALQELSAQVLTVHLRTPLPGLAELPGLVEQLQKAGVPAVLEADDLPAVPTNLQATVYRIVQESLTNVVKHAGEVPVEVRLRPQAGGLEVRVVNTGGRRPDAPFPSGGRGLAGLRERAAVFGGRVDAGATATGFAVQAWLPCLGTKLEA